MASKPIALITGGSKGIGAATAERLADDGYTVVLTYSSDSSAADATVSKVEAKHGKGSVFAYKVDAGSVEAVNTFAPELLKLGTVKAIIANAADASLADLTTATNELYDKMFDVNTKGVLFLIKALAPHMPAGGSIVLVSTGATAYSAVNPGFLIYAATKGALEQMGRVLSKELMPRNITVNVIRPGPIDTAMMHRAAPTDEIKAAFASFSPANRVGRPEEVASVISFFVGPDSRWVSGQAINVDGAAVV